MRSRLAAAYGAVALASPGLALAQAAGAGEDASRGITWVWIAAAVLVVAALVSLFFGRSADEDRTGAPPARRPGRP